MKVLRRTILFDLFKGFDLLIMGISLLTTSKLSVLKLDIKTIISVSAFLLAGHLCLKNTGAYNSRRFRSFKSEIKSCLYTTIFSSITLLVTGTLFKLEFNTTHTIALYITTCFLLLMLNRLILYFLMELAIIFGRNLRTVFIAGTNKRAMILAKELPKLGYIIKGFIDDRWRIKPSNDIPLITDYQKALRENHVDEVIICLPLKTEYSKIQEIINTTEEQGILTRLSTNLFDLKIAKAKIEHLNDTPLLTLYSGNMYRKMSLVKEIIDTSLALICLLLLLPLFLIIIVTIKLSSKGPVFFLQNRLGMNKKLFKVIKFRTMIPNAEIKLKDIEHLNERKGEATFKIKNDPRVTPIGKILRKFSLDELPQLINVLKGDMSMVGPRPLPVRDYSNFQEDWQRRRFSVKPGITCLWQISGRDNIDFETWMELDNQYIDNWSILLDLKILLKTIPAVISGHGAS